MAKDLKPQIFVCQNPWRRSLADAVLFKHLQTAAVMVQEELIGLRAAREVAEDCSYAFLMLDPTRPRDQVTIEQRTMAIVLFGRNAKGYVPNAAAKADAHDRHGRPNGELIDEASFCLGDSDFAWGRSASYQGAIAAGSGLSVDQDYDMAYLLLSKFLEPVRTVRDTWLKEQRASLGGQRWFNTHDVPGEQYTALGCMREFVQLEMS